MSDHPRDLLRKELRKLRSSQSNKEIQHNSHAICARVAPLVETAQHIAGYYAFGAEVDLSTLMSNLEVRGKVTYVPVVLPDFRMDFAPVNSQTPVTLNRYGIKEPEVERACHVTVAQLDAVLVPLVGFDEACNRMGMGGGYYDRCFANRQDERNNTPLLIGVAYELQGVETVYAQSWDVPLDYIVTESRVIQRPVSMTD